MTVDCAIGQMGGFAEVEAGPVGVFVGVKEYVRSVIFVVTVPSAP